MKLKQEMKILSLKHKKFSFSFEFCKIESFEMKAMDWNMTWNKF